VYTGFRWGNLNERDRMEDPGVDGRITVKWIFMKWDGGIVGLMWLRTGTSSVLL